MHHTLAPVAVDASTGELIRSPTTGFVERLHYETGGEILVRIKSEHAFPGYFRDPAATAKRFARDVFETGDLWYRSGDALRRTNDGRWYFLDRIGDTYRWKSENVSTAEVSEVLGKYPGITEAVVYGVKLPNYEGKAGCAALKLDANSLTKVDFNKLHKFAQAELPPPAVPTFLRLGDFSAHTPNNKQNKVQLREQGVDPERLNSDARILWCRPGVQGYQPFNFEDWNKIKQLQVRL
jgi:acyl-CoA synthetase (AMP-forming)/AMP-acid ligase II